MVNSKTKHIYLRENVQLTLFDKFVFYHFCLKFEEFLHLKGLKW